MHSYLQTIKVSVNKLLDRNAVTLPLFCIEQSKLENNFCFIDDNFFFLRHQQEYEEPLYKRNIICQDRVKIIFKHIHEIIQCHQVFNIALSDRMSKWVTEDLIGDVLHASVRTVAFN